jgi:hypothetical protein
MQKVAIASMCTLWLCLFSVRLTAFYVLQNALENNLLLKKKTVNEIFFRQVFHDHIPLSLFPRAPDYILSAVWNFSFFLKDMTQHNVHPQWEKCS